MDSFILRVEHLRIAISGADILNDISLEIKKGEQWAVFGKAGSGKTVFAQALAGRRGYSGLIAVSPENTNHSIVLVDQQHRFRDLKNQGHFYYQQRYHSFDAEATMTVKQYLTDLGEVHTDKAQLNELLDVFELKALIHQPLIQLSNGENKRLQILKAVLCYPLLLILDEPYAGVDSDGRKMLERIFVSVQHSGMHLILFSSRDYIPVGFNRFAHLQNGSLLLMEDASLIHESYRVGDSPEPDPFPSAITFTYPAFEYAVRMKKVNLHYEGKNILQGIDWEIKKGECWALTGHNGAGKSTLLSLMTGDNPQAYSNEIYLFDRKRGTGESIWDIKEKIGFLSPELQLYFDSAATAFTALASGLFDTIGLFRQLSPDQEKLVLEWLEFLHCSSLKGRLLNSLPAGLQRLILLGRAMIKTPPFLILDEPCQGLDAAQTAFALRIIERYCAQYEASLIFVSHYATDFPVSVTKTLRLVQGKVV